MFLVPRAGSISDQSACGFERLALLWLHSAFDHGYDFHLGTRSFGVFRPHIVFAVCTCDMTQPLQIVSAVFCGG